MLRHAFVPHHEALEKRRKNGFRSSHRASGHPHRGAICEKPPSDEEICVFGSPFGARTCRSVPGKRDLYICGETGAWFFATGLALVLSDEEFEETQVDQPSWQPLAPISSTQNRKEALGRAGEGSDGWQVGGWPYSMPTALIRRYPEPSKRPRSEEATSVLTVSSGSSNTAKEAPSAEQLSRLDVQFPSASEKW